MSSRKDARPRPSRERRLMMLSWCSVRICVGGENHVRVCDMTMIRQRPTTIHHDIITIYPRSSTIPPRYDHDPPRSATIRRDPPRSTTIHHDPPRSTTIRHDSPRSTTIHHESPRSATIHREGRTRDRCHKREHAEPLGTQINLRTRFCLSLDTCDIAWKLCKV